MKKSTKRPVLKPDEIKIVELKARGLTSKQIAEQVYPDKKSGDSMVRHKAQSITIQDAVRAEMAKQGISLEAVIKPVAKALKAKTRIQTGTEKIYDTKGKVIGTEPVYGYEDDLRMQLAGSDRATKLMGIDKAVSDEPIGLTPEEMNRLASESDEVTLTQLLFKKQG